MIRILALLTIMFTQFSSCASKNQPVLGSTTITAEALINLINAGENVYAENKVIEGDIDFTKLKNANLESKFVHRANLTSSLTFINCIFNGKVIGYSANDSITKVVTFMKNISCIECDFKEEVTLRENNFYGIANFAGSTFHKKTSFEGSNFFSEGAFSKTGFTDEARFQNTYFHNKVNFIESTFGKTISFQGANFMGDAQFSVTKYWGYADFSVCTFSSGVFFNYAEFSKQAIFNNTAFKGRVEFLKSVFSSNTEFKNCIFYNLSKFNESTIGNTFNLQNSVFIYAKPDMSKIIKTDTTKLILENTRTTSLQPFTEQDF